MLLQFLSAYTQYTGWTALNYIIIRDVELVEAKCVHPSGFYFNYLSFHTKVPYIVKTDHSRV